MCQFYVSPPSCLCLRHYISGCKGFVLLADVGEQMLAECRILYDIVRQCNWWEKEKIKIVILYAKELAKFCLQFLLDYGIIFTFCAW